MGVTEGLAVGDRDGLDDGFADGDAVGERDGLRDGLAVGASLVHAPSALAALQPPDAPAHTRVPAQPASPQHACPVPHGVHAGPPQSTSVSSPVLAPFEQPAALGL